MLKLYIDWISQPSRAVKATLDILNVEYQVCPIKIQDNDHRHEQFTKLNPLSQVPLLIDGDYILAESHSIMKYIIRSRNIQTSLYPYDDVKQMARIDEYLDYHHTNTRKCFPLYFNILVAPRKGITTGININNLQTEVFSVLRHIDHNLLAKQQYLCGNELTIADISACSEIMQLHMITYDFSQFKKLDQWLYKVFKVPQIHQAHEVALKIIKKQNPNCRFLN